MLSTYARHPKLTRLCEMLASTSKVTEAEACEIVEASARDAGITALDIEMYQPGTEARVPFAPMASTAPGGDHGERIRHHVHLMLNGAKQ